MDTARYVIDATRYVLDTARHAMDTAEYAMDTAEYAQVEGASLDADGYQGTFLERIDGMWSYPETTSNISREN
jgi:hypothetical protein